MKETPVETVVRPELIDSDWFQGGREKGATLSEVSGRLDVKLASRPVGQIPPLVLRSSSTSTEPFAPSVEPISTFAYPVPVALLSELTFLQSLLLCESI